MLVHIWKLTAAQRIKGSLDNNTEGDLAGDLEVTWLAEEGEFRPHPRGTTAGVLWEESHPYVLVSGLCLTRPHLTLLFVAWASRAKQMSCFLPATWQVTQAQGILLLSSLTMTRPEEQ